MANGHVIDDFTCFAKQSVFLFVLRCLLFAVRRCTVILVITIVVWILIVIERSWIPGYYQTVTDEKLNDFFPAFAENMHSEEELSTTRDTRYILYGNGNATQQTARQLSQYIRALTSRQAPGGRHLRRTSGHFSQIGQSQLVDKLLKRRRGGVFLECGAHDGETFSNSLFFELHRNWTGVLIEGNVNHYPALLSKNRNAFVVRACVSTTAKPETVMYKIEGITYGIMTYNVVNRSPAVKVVPTPCFPLNSITAALGIRHIDYMSLDVEGAELNILQTVNWSQLSIDVLTIEYGRSTILLNQLRSLFKATGKYKQVGLLPHGMKDHTGQDVVFMRTR